MFSKLKKQTQKAMKLNSKRKFHCNLDKLVKNFKVINHILLAEFYNISL